MKIRSFVLNAVTKYLKEDLHASITDNIDYSLFVACIQGVMIFLKKNANEIVTEKLKSQELMDYLDNGFSRAIDGEGRSI